MSNGPRNVNISDVLINTAGACIAGFIGSVIILLIVFISSSFLNIPGTFESARLAGGTTNPMFPFILSFITAIAMIITTLLAAKLLTMTDGDKYQSRAEIYWQIGFFHIIIYLCFAPIYIYTGLQSYDTIMVIFIAHVLLSSFGCFLLLELMNSYRYVLIGLYGNFIALCISSSLMFLMFYSLSTGRAKLYILLLIIPLTITLMTFLRGIFELLYSAYFRMTNTDGLGDIFYRIEQEEKEAERIAEQKNSI